MVWGLSCCFSPPERGVAHRNLGSRRISDWRTGYGCTCPSHTVRSCRTRRCASHTPYRVKKALWLAHTVLCSAPQPRIKQSQRDFTDWTDCSLKHSCEVVAEQVAAQYIMPQCLCRSVRRGRIKGQALLRPKACCSQSCSADVSMCHAGGRGAVCAHAESDKGAARWRPAVVRSSSEPPGLCQGAQGRHLQMGPLPSQKQHPWQAEHRGGRAWHEGQDDSQLLRPGCCRSWLSARS